MTVDTTQRQPNTSWNSQYPYNQSIVYESGHFDEWDSTPGNTRRRHGHKSGTYEEISEDGHIVQVTVNNHSSYIKGGWTITCDKNGDLKIGGHGRVTCGSDMHLEVGSNCSITSNGTLSIVSVGGGSIVTQGSVTIIAGNNANIKCGQNANVQIGGDCNANVSGNMVVQAGKNLTANVGQNLTATVSQDASITAQGKATVSGQSEVLIKSNNVNLGGEGGSGVVTVAGISSTVKAIL